MPRLVHAQTSATAPAAALQPSGDVGRQQVHRPESSPSDAEFREGLPQKGQPSAPTHGSGDAGAQAGPRTSDGRKRIGLALGGGGALALSEIGVLRWMEEHHVPVDVIAGTSMGSLVGALYATGHTPEQMAALTSDQVFSQVFRISEDFRKENFRRREDARFLPGGLTLGLRHGVSLRNGVLLDYGLNQFLNAQFLPYGAGFSFDDLPLPFRSVATDILVGREAVFTKGPLAEAVRASLSIPGVFPPVQDGGHIYVDGALTENLPTDLVKRDLHADVVLAVSLPLTPPDAGDTQSLLGILQRSFSVASWSNEVRSRALADVLIEPVAPSGIGAADYARSDQLNEAGYLAAQKVSAQLLQYRVNDADWEVYQARRQHREPAPLRNIARVDVIAPTQTDANGIWNTVLDLPRKQLNAEIIGDRLDEVRGDGRFETYYFLTKPGEAVDMRVTGPANVGRRVQGRELLHPEEKRGPGDELAAERAASGKSQAPDAASILGQTTRNNTIQAGSRNGKQDKNKQSIETVVPVSQSNMAFAQAAPAEGYRPQPGDRDLNLWVVDRPGGPPYLRLGGNVIAQSGGTARATVDAVITQQDLGSYRSELRTRLRFGFLTELVPEYYARINGTRFFAAPRLQFYRAPVYIWASQRKIAERNTQMAGGGVDVGFAQTRSTEWRAGWQEIVERWNTVTGSDGLPDISTTAQTARLQYRFNNQDRAIVPLHGLRLDATAGFMHIRRNENVPRLEATGTYFRDIGHGNTLSFSVEGGTFANRHVDDPFRFTLGGPLRLSASSYDEYRGTDYVFARPAYFRRIASLPTPLGQSIYILGAYEVGRIYAPETTPVMRQDVFFGLAAETPLGAITFGPAIGDHDHRKIVFTLGRFF